MIAVGGYNALIGSGRLIDDKIYAVGVTRLALVNHIYILSYVYLCLNEFFRRIPAPIPALFMSFLMERSGMKNLFEKRDSSSFLRGTQNDILVLPGEGFVVSRIDMGLVLLAMTGWRLKDEGTRKIIRASIEMKIRRDYNNAI